MVKRVVVTLAIAAVVTASVAAVQRGGGGGVQSIAGGQRLRPDAGQKGATFNALESQATRLTTKFADATVVAERSLDGAVVTRVTDGGGNELGRLHVERIDRTTHALHYASASGKVLQTYADPAVQPTLHWANQQAYGLWKDRVEGDASGLEWQGGYLRPKGSARRDLGPAIQELETKWINGLSARSYRRTHSQYRPVPGRSVRSEVLVARLTKDGADAGTLNWVPEDRVLMWDLPGLTKGYVAPEHLIAQYGGWPFTPDMEWLNIQALAFHHYKTLINQQRFVAQQQAPPGWLARAWQRFAPTLSANEAGCDDLHWLDGTVLRFCCDVHDYCYEKSACASSSWWQFWRSWSCDSCNIWVISCFMSGGNPSNWNPAQ